MTHTLPVFSSTNKTVDVGWSPPSDGATKVETLTCEVIDLSGNVVLTKSFDKPLPDKVSFDVEELAAKVTVPNAELQCQAAYVSSKSDVANSAYRVDSTKFEILSPPTKLSVAYTENKSGGVLSISWLPVSDVDRYQVQLVDTVSKMVAVSREFNSTHEVHKTTGRYITSYKLLPSDMNKLQQGHDYSVRIYSLGNDSSLLFSVTPTDVVHYLEKVKTMSATYNQDTDDI